MENKEELEVTEEVKEQKTFDVLIEEKRAPLYKEFTNSRKIGNILTFAILIIAIVGMYLVSGDSSKTQKIIGWVVLVAGMAAMVAFYFLSKKKFETHTKAYIQFVNDTLNNASFTDSRFTDIVSTDTKVEVTDLAGNGVYTDVVKVASRNIVNGKYDGASFKFAEAAIYKKTDNKRQPAIAAFVGKYFELENSLKFEGNFVINIFRENPFDTPNGISGKATLYTQEGITVYGDEGADFRKVLGEEFFGNLKKIKAVNHLLNLAISFYEGRTYVFMSYDDEVIAMPFDRPINPEGFNSFTEDLKKVFETLKLLGK